MEHPDIHTAETLWTRSPSAMRWDPSFTMRWSELDRTGRRFKPLGDLVRYARQGVHMGALDRGDVGAATVGVGEIHRLLVGKGEFRSVTVDAIARHIASPGDVLVSRVGRVGRAAVVGESARDMVPRDSVLVATPRESLWGPVIAAALSTNAIGQFMMAMSAGRFASCLTVEQLLEMPIPVPSPAEVVKVASLSKQADELVESAGELFEKVRGEIQISLEGAPTETLSHMSCWLDDIDELRAWSWQDLRRSWVRRQGRANLRGLRRLDDAASLASHQAKTEYGPAVPSLTLQYSDLRGDWYLALPQLKTNNDDDQLEPSMDSSQGKLVKRYFIVDREALLIPVVGDTAAAPVIVPADVFRRAGEPLMVPIYWLPFVGLPYPRCLALLLDHPFLQLQRRVGAAFSTSPHLTREEVESLLIPTFPDSTMLRWEQSLREAQAKYIEASILADEVLALAETWYAPLGKHT